MMDMYEKLRENRESEREAGVSDTCVFSRENVCKDFEKHKTCLYAAGGVGQAVEVFALC